MSKVVFSDNLEYLGSMESESVNLIYIDPPFNTGKRKSHQRKVGGVGVGNKLSYGDSFDDFPGFMLPRLEEAHRILSEIGTLYVHLDWRESHYCKIVLDSIFGRENFLNEIIWAYDYGGRSKKKWPTKHDTILVYVKDKNKYIWNYEEIERIPYMSPGLVGKEKAARGKTPTDVWWHTIVPTQGKERLGYPTQKPMGVLRRVIQASSKPGDVVLDFFAGSGTTGDAALELGRDFILVDNNPEAIEVMRKRFSGKNIIFEE